MRPIIQVITSELEGTPLFALNLFDSSGQHADQIVREVTDPLTILDAVLDVTIAHRIQTSDVWTDDEDIFVLFIAMPGFNAKLVGAADLAPLYDVLCPANPTFGVIQELYLNKRGNDECGDLNGTRNLLHRMSGLTKFAHDTTERLSKRADALKTAVRNWTRLFDRN